MLFNSYLFILLFLPFSVCGYFALNRFGKYKAASAFLLLMSLWFYAYFNPKYLILILLSIALNYAIYLGMSRGLSDNARKLLLALGLVFNIGLIFYYKYYDFFIENINALFASDFTLHHLVLPLGISFFTFQQVSFIIDAYKREVPHYDFLDYALFVSYFPQLIAGPIVTHDEIVPQFSDKQKRKIDYDNMSAGLYLFVLGLAKKVLIADTFGEAVRVGYSDVSALNSTSALVVMLSYTIQIYFDFSGYCDMASGIARMMNIDLPENFNAPYKAHSIVEFWRRWHITLTRFFTRYVYLPLGGNRRGVIRTYVNIMIVFLLSGIWHGAAWTFVLWGVLHGALSVASRSLSKYTDKLPRIVRVALTFTLVNFLWVLFRAPTLEQAVLFFKRIFSFDLGCVSADMLGAFDLPELAFLLTRLFRFNVTLKYPVLLMLVFFALSLFIIFFVPTAREQTRGFNPTIIRLSVMCVLLCWCICSLSGVSAFLYFNF